MFLLYIVVPLQKKNYMTHFRNISTEEQLKASYRKLALAYHPDKGGNNRIMQSINAEYNLLSNEFKRNSNMLNLLTVGDEVFVNGTECIVIMADNSTFVAKAKGRNKIAVFERNTGLGKYNKRYRAYVN